MMKKFFFLTLFVMYSYAFNVQAGDWVDGAKILLTALSDFVVGKKQKEAIESLEAKNMKIVEDQKQTNSILVGQLGLQKQTNDILAVQASDQHVIKDGINQSNGNINKMNDALEKQIATQNVAAGIAIVYGSLGIIKSGFEFYHWMWPSKEEVQKKINEEKEVMLKYRRLCAEEAMNECLALARNTGVQRGSDGMPCKCENALREFEKVAGTDAFERVRGAFNRCSKK